MTKKEATAIIESILNQVENPSEKIEILQQMIPGAVERFESFEFLKLRISKKIDEKGKYTTNPKKKKYEKTRI